MKILIDINHPAHVHYFRNFIKLMEAKGHKFCIINRDNEMINGLLDYNGIEHIIRGSRQNKKVSLIKTLYGLAKTVAFNVKISRRFKVDMYVGFASAPCALASFFLRKPCVLLDDTDHNIKNQTIYLPFVSRVILPFYFYNKLFDSYIGKRKSCILNAYIEQLYLHSSVYNANSEALEKLSLKRKEYVIVRFSAFDASHDAKVVHLSNELRKDIIRKVSEKYRVILSIEKPSEDPFFEQYIVNFPPQEMHDLLFNAKFLVTEGATMASEAFVLGVPYLYLNPLKCGNIEYQCNNFQKRAYKSLDEITIMNMIDRLIHVEVNQNAERTRLEQQTDNPTKLLVNYIDSWPKYKNNKQMLSIFITK